MSETIIAYTTRLKSCHPQHKTVDLHNTQREQLVATGCVKIQFTCKRPTLKNSEQHFHTPLNSLVFFYGICRHDCKCDNIPNSKQI
jgi:hypothetical protein